MAPAAIQTSCLVKPTDRRERNDLKRGGGALPRFPHLRHGQRYDAELIVMDAYGLSRLREWMVGGLTRELLNGTPVCCLPNH